MGEDFLTMNNILTADEAASFFVDTKETLDTTEETKQQKETTEKQTEEQLTTEIEKGVNPFMEEFEEPSESESVGSEKKNNKELEDTASKESDGTPSNKNFYSSIASALKEEGVFPDLEDDAVDSIVEAEDFRDLVLKQIEAGLDEVQKRIYEALNDGVEPTAIRQYENTLGYLNSITEELINDESEQGENLRRRLLLQDFMNRGYSQDRAVKMTEKLFASGEDIEEAKLALLGNKEYFGGKYQDLLDEAKEEATKKRKALEKQAELLKKDILSNEIVFGDINIDKGTRQKVYDNISKPVYRDKETGTYYTALQKYRMENENDYLKNVGLLFTLTDGFTNLEKLVKPSAKKEVKKKLKELEHTLNNTARDSGGILKFVGNGANSSAKSFLDRGFVLDVSKRL